VNERLDPDSASSADESPEIAEVRRLLAEARHDEPMPDDVAARLEDVLVDLSSPSSTRGEPRPVAAVVTPISDHRRRRAVVQVVAAAAIVVGGVVLVQNVHLTSTSSSGSAAENSAADAQAGGRSPTGPKHATPSQQRAKDFAAADKPVVVHPHRFTLDALKARTKLGRAAPAPPADAVACPDLPQHARAVRAEYRNAPAALVYRRPQGSSQVVDLYVCGSTGPIRTTTLPAP
jgi:hypothetical protein